MVMQENMCVCLWENIQTKSLVFSIGRKKGERERETSKLKKNKTKTFRDISTDCNIRTLFPYQLQYIVIFLNYGTKRFKHCLDI